MERGMLNILYKYGNWLTFRHERGLVPIALRHYVSIALPLSI